MGFLSNKVQVEDLQPGDHIYTWRGLTYAHHGIFMGGGQVIHYGARSEAEEAAASECIVDKMMAKAKKKAVKTSLWSNSSGSIKCKECSSHVKSKSCVSKICVRCFLQGGHMYRYEYGVNPLVQQVKRAGTCTPQKATDEAEKILHRAEYLLSSEIGFGEYHLLRRNCEDFTLFCRLGIVGLGQGLSGQAAPLKKNMGIAKNIQVEDLVVELESQSENETQSQTTIEESTPPTHELDI